MLVCSKGEKKMNKNVYSILEITCAVLIWGTIITGSFYLFPHYDNITTNLVITLGYTDPFNLYGIRLVLGFLFVIAIMLISAAGSIKLTEAIFKRSNFQKNKFAFCPRCKHLMPIVGKSSKIERTRFLRMSHWFTIYELNCETCGRISYKVKGTKITKM